MRGAPSAVPRLDRRNHMLSLYRPFNDLFRDDFFDRELGAFFNAATAGRRGFQPAVDVLDTEHAYLLKAELPGVAPEEIEIKVENGVLTLTGERRHEADREDQGYRRIERSYGKFSRSFTVPEGTRADAIEAHADNGVLTVTIPKVVKEAPHKIPIKTGGLVDKAKKMFAKGESESAA
jgi:HSP20 family protein